MSRMRLRKILIVDDDPFACDVLRKLLMTKGYQVAVSYRSEEALSMYASERPGLVLLDIRMPGKPGLETLRDIKAFDPKANVIIVSAVRDDHVAREARAEGALEYLKKPVNPHHLEQLLVAIDHSIW